MKVLFVVKSMAIEPLGPMYLAAVVKQAGHEAKIIDVENAFMFSKLWKPEMIGFSVMTGDQKRFIALAGEIKDYWVRKKNAPAILVGGPHVTFFPEDFKDNDNINMVVKGEGEDILAELLHSPVQYPSIDDFPWPDRTDFAGHRIRDFIASRGCSYNKCGYCYNGAWTKLFPDLAQVRTRSVGDVINEINSTAAEFVYFQDSTFAPSMKWMREFAVAYRRSINIPYHVHLRPNQVTEERVLLLHDSNCVSVKIALETASDRLRQLINRGNTNNKDALTASRLFKKWDIQLILQNILGLPTATIEDDLATLEVNIQCKPAYAWSSIFQPYPATELGDWCKKEGLYLGDYSEISDSFFDKSVLNIPEEHKEQIVCLQRIFAFCVEMQIMPEIRDLTYETLPMFIHKSMRKIGDRRMFPGII